MYPTSRVYLQCAFIVMYKTLLDALYFPSGGSTVYICYPSSNFRNFLGDIFLINSKFQKFSLIYF